MQIRFVYKSLKKKRWAALFSGPAQMGRWSLSFFGLVLIIGALKPFFSALGAAMSAVTYLITLSFFLSTLGVAEPTAGGFPTISAMAGQFLLKDLVLLAASLCLLGASVQGPWFKA